VLVPPEFAALLVPSVAFSVVDYARHRQGFPLTLM
jgi:hypothetical protein